MALRLLWGAPIMYSPYEMPHNINYLNPLTLSHNTHYGKYTTNPMLYVMPL